MFITVCVVQPIHCWSQWLVLLNKPLSFLYALQKSIKPVQSVEQVSKPYQSINIRADCIQTISPRVQVSTRVRTCTPY